MLLKKDLCDLWKGSNPLKIFLLKTSYSHIIVYSWATSVFDDVISYWMQTLMREHVVGLL